MLAHGVAGVGLLAPAIWPGSFPQTDSAPPREGALSQVFIRLVGCAAQCMCMCPPPPRVAGMRTTANAAKATEIRAAPRAPRLKALAAPSMVVNAPAEVAIAERTATPRAAPTSW